MIKYRLCAFVFCMLTFCTQLLYAQTPSKKEIDNLTIAWAELNASTMPPEFRNVVSLIPLNLINELSYLSIRYNKVEEKILSTNKKRMKEIEDAKISLANERKKRDSLFITTTNVYKKQADLITADKAIKKAEEKLQSLLSENQSKNVNIDKENTYSNLTLHSVNKSGKLLPQVNNPRQVCIEENCDLLVYGNVKSNSSFISVTISVYVRSIDAILYSITEYASSDSLDSIVSAISRPLAEAIIGKNFSIVTFDVTPTYANIFIDGKKQNTKNLIFFENGTHEINIFCDGFLAKNDSFSCVLGLDESFTYSLEKIEAKPIFIESEPVNASIYVDGKLIGKTPLSIPWESSLQVAHITMPGFKDIQYVFREENSGQTISVILEEDDGLKFDDTFGKAKDNFYHSLGYFVLSLPISVLSGGLFQTYYSTMQNISSSSLTESQKEEISKNYYTTQIVFLSSVVVSGGLAVNSIIDLVKYIKAAD